MIRKVQRMSIIRVKDHEIYYEEWGKGIPILFLEGLGYSVWMWRKQLQDISSWAHCILVDNRGVGKSSPLTSPYSVREFAEDAMEVMDHLGIDRFFVLGVSMGGFIAQEIAIMAENRVKGTILISTSCGGGNSLPMPKSTWDEMEKTIPGESVREKLIRTMKIAMTDKFPRERRLEFESIIEERLDYLQDQTQMVYQALATKDYDACDANKKINTPSLIVCGTEDRVLPWTNSLIIFKSLRNSSLLVFKNQNHLLFIEEAPRVNDEIRNFVRLVEEDSYIPYVREVH